MWRRAELRCIWRGRQLSGAAGRRVEDEGDWLYSPEWWGTESQGHTVFQATSDKGNGLVKVIAYPSSRPSKVYWPETERLLQQRYGEIHPGHEHRECFRILGYQWRVLRFNDETRQSTAKVMAVLREAEPHSVQFVQQPHCLAVPYLKSMVSVGLASITSCNYDIIDAVQGKKTMNILCVGHGGGSLPLFLASKIQGAIVHVVEIDPLVILASIQAMGFPYFSARRLSDCDVIDEVIWKGIHERLYLFESDAEEFILDNTNLYDLIFIDAYDGDDIFPQKLWDPDSVFLKALSERLHPTHGTVVVNLHSSSEVFNPDESVPSIIEQIFPLGRYVHRVCQAYKDTLVGTGSPYRNGFGLVFTVAVPWVCNTSLVVCRGFQRGGKNMDRDLVTNTLISKSLQLEHILNLPFSCLQYIKGGFTLVH